MFAQRKFMYAALVAMLALAALACNMPTSGSPTTIPPTAPPTAGGLPAAPTPTTAGTTEPAQPTPETGGPLVAVPPEGGFQTGTQIDAATLPTSFIPAVGVGGAFCSTQTADKMLELLSVVGTSFQLCIYNWEISATGSPSMKVDLTDPDGTAYSDQYTFGGVDDNVFVTGEAGPAGGNVYMGTNLPEGMTPAVGINVRIPPAATPGAWTITVTDLVNGTVIGPTQVNPQYNGEVITVDRTANKVVFSPEYTPFTTDDVLYITGAGQPANTQITVALYLEDEANLSEFGTPTLLPKYAATVTTDSVGRFAVEFVVGPNTPRGQYLASAATAFTADTFINPFTGGFEIQ